MSTRFRVWFVAALVALLVLLIAHWFDAGVLVDAQRRAGTTFDNGPLFDLIPVAHMLTAAGVVALSLVVWWSRSLLVGVCYALIGGYLVFLPPLVWTFDTVKNGMSAPLAPQPIANVLGQWFLSVEGVTAVAS